MQMRFVPPAYEAGCIATFDLAVAHNAAMRGMTHPRQTAFVREKALYADIIVTMGLPAPGGCPSARGIVTNFIRGSAIVTNTASLRGREPRILAALVLDDVADALWVLAYGEGDRATKARRDLRQEDPGAINRIPFWLALGMQAHAHDLGKAVRANPGDTTAPAEIRAAVRYAVS